MRWDRHDHRAAIGPAGGRGDGPDPAPEVVEDSDPATYLSGQQHAASNSAVFDGATEPVHRRRPGENAP
jgi:hypothetical protein